MLLLLLLLLLQALAASVAHAFAVSREGHAITITCSLPSGCDVRDVWAAAEVAGSLHTHMASIASECVGQAGSVRCICRQQPERAARAVRL
jgi:hypothetical protein